MLHKELVGFEEATGELRVNAFVREATTKVKLDEVGSLSVPVQANVQGLSSDQVHQLNQVLEKHYAEFSQEDQDYGYSTVLHCIPTGDVHPIKQRHRRIPPHVFQELRQHVQTWLHRVYKRRAAAIGSCSRGIGLYVFLVITVNIAM